jgi:hypothetical protein
MSHLVFVNPYLTGRSAQIANSATPGVSEPGTRLRATIWVNSLPGELRSVHGVAVRSDSAEP